jgi:hypothetical protein
MPTKTYGEIGYDAYGATTDHKAWDGRPMPKWEELPPNIVTAWEAAATAIANEHAKHIARACDETEPLPSTVRT